MRIATGLCLGLGSLFLLALNVSAAQAGAPQRTICRVTLANLETAFNGESNAQARYLEFAKKADEEGYKGVASLFRAAARAELIHAANHLAVIKAAGGTAAIKIDTVTVKSTAENLRAAIEGETYERDRMYPDFVTQARTVGEEVAVQTFTLARAAEAEHARLYSEALLNLESRREAQTFYVCPVCGFTTPNLDFKNCPTCATPAEKYESVS